MKTLLAVLGGTALGYGVAYAIAASKNQADAVNPLAPPSPDPLLNPGSTPNPGVGSQPTTPRSRLVMTGNPFNPVKVVTS